MLGDVGQARTNAAMLLLMIDTTSSRTFAQNPLLCVRAFFSFNPNDIDFPKTL